MYGESLGRSRRPSIGLAASISLTVMFVACSSSEGTFIPPLGQGSCAASVVGEGISENVAGSAVFGYQTGAEGLTQWVFFLWDGNYYGDSFDIITLFRTNLTIPAPGTYEIQDASEDPETENDFLAGWVFSSPSAFATFLSVTGTITITSSSDEQVSGTFEFSGAQREGAFGVTADSVMVSGSFTAVPGDVPGA